MQQRHLLVTQRNRPTNSVIIHSLVFFGMWAKRPVFDSQPMRVDVPLKSLLCVKRDVMACPVQTNYKAHLSKKQEGN
jgi:hypothetical protein